MKGQDSSTKTGYKVEKWGPWTPGPGLGHPLWEAAQEGKNPGPALISGKAPSSVGQELKSVPASGKLLPDPVKLARVTALFSKGFSRVKSLS